STSTAGAARAWVAAPDSPDRQGVEPTESEDKWRRRFRRFLQERGLINATTGTRPGRRDGAAEGAQVADVKSGLGELADAPSHAEVAEFDARWPASLKDVDDFLNGSANSVDTEPVVDHSTESADIDRVVACSQSFLADSSDSSDGSDRDAADADSADSEATCEELASRMLDEFLVRSPSSSQVAGAAAAAEDPAQVEAELNDSQRDLFAVEDYEDDNEDEEQQDEHRDEAEEAAGQLDAATLLQFVRMEEQDSVLAVAFDGGSDSDDEDDEDEEAGDEGRDQRAASAGRRAVVVGEAAAKDARAAAATTAAGQARPPTWPLHGFKAGCGVSGGGIFDVLEVAAWSNRLVESLQARGSSWAAAAASQAGHAAGKRRSVAPPSPPSPPSQPPPSSPHRSLLNPLRLSLHRQRPASSCRSHSNSPVSPLRVSDCRLPRNSISSGSSPAGQIRLHQTLRNLLAPNNSPEPPSTLPKRQPAMAHVYAPLVAPRPASVADSLWTLGLFPCPAATRAAPTRRRFDDLRQFDSLGGRGVAGLASFDRASALAAASVSMSTSTAPLLPLPAADRPAIERPGRPVLEGPPQPPPDKLANLLRNPPPPPQKPPSTTPSIRHRAYPRPAAAIGGSGIGRKEAAGADQSEVPSVPIGDFSDVKFPRLQCRHPLPPPPPPPPPRSSADGLTLASLEVATAARPGLLPDPRNDAIVAAFLTHCLFVAATDARGRPSDSRIRFAATRFQAVRDEAALLEALADNVRCADPDIVLGLIRHPQRASWGYLIDRAKQLQGPPESGGGGLPMAQLLSRYALLPHQQQHRRRREPEANCSQQPEDGLAGSYEAQSDSLRIGGRVVINLWRLLRYELSKLRSNSFEACAALVLNR
uniref:RING-type domain-containing protein n=1 Tax=Macrostomum lignano TaxID=282301 RepID=A0A1I8FJQ3_9PLAT